MSDVGLGPREEAHVQQAADEAYRVLTGNAEPLPRRRFAETLRQVTLEAPLHALTIAFLLGVLIARRR
jgi:hypothetical protein